MVIAYYIVGSVHYFYNKIVQSVCMWARSVRALLYYVSVVSLVAFDRTASTHQFANRRKWWSLLLISRKHVLVGLVIVVFFQSPNPFVADISVRYESSHDYKSPYPPPLTSPAHLLLRLLFLSPVPPSIEIQQSPSVKVYPIGIPSLYFFILWTQREALNPRLRPPSGEVGRADVENNSSVTSVRSIGSRAARENAKEIEERVQSRKSNPDLAPSIFLWRDFGEPFRTVCRHVLTMLIRCGMVSWWSS